MRPKMENKNLFPELSQPITHRCVVYHDESMGVFTNKIWAHGLYFVPEHAWGTLLEHLWGIREKLGCEDKKFHFKDISGAKICKKDGSIAIREWIQYGVESLRTKGSSIFRPPLSCKLGIIFFPSSVGLNLYGGHKKGEKMLRYFETVLRMLLKGCAHGLYGESNKLEVTDIITDGKPWHRLLDEIRILDRLVSEAKEHVRIDKNACIEAMNSDHTSSGCTNKDKAQFLQLTDLLLGSAIHCCFRRLKYGAKKEKLIRPVRDLFDKRKRGANFRHSGHYRSFSLSFASIKNGEWEFSQPDSEKVVSEDYQIDLFRSI